MSLLDLSASALLDRLASTDPTPGGGSAARLGGRDRRRAGRDGGRNGEDAQRRPGGADAPPVGTDAVHAAGQRLRGLVDEDSAAYDAVMAAYRLPKQTDDEKAARKARIQAALERAHRRAAAHGGGLSRGPQGVPDAAADGQSQCAVRRAHRRALAWAGLRGALENVRINTGDDHPARARASQLRAEAAEALGRLGLG